MLSFVGLTSRCKYYTNPKYEYRDFLSLNEIHDSQPAGYQARLSFYAQGTRNAHILLSRTSNPNVLVDNVYEISEYFVLLLVYLKSQCISFVFNYFDFSSWWMGEYTRSDST